MKIRRTKSRMKVAISCTVAVICAAGICVSGYEIIRWLIDSANTKNQSAAIDESSVVSERDDDEDTEIMEDDGRNSYYRKYISMRLIDVDFDELRRINPETAGWISLSGTNINYPFTKTSNNDFYLYHSFDRSYNRAGWVFADYRNKTDGTDRNMILYAHGRYDDTMFGTLRNILTAGWLKHPENFTVRTATDAESVVWQVFSVYRIPTTSDYIRTEFTNNTQFDGFVQMLKNRSAYDFNTNVSGSDRILTLSTCYSSTERVVLHAKLIKRGPRK